MNSFRVDRQHILRRPAALSCAGISTPNAWRRQQWKINATALCIRQMPFAKHVPIRTRMHDAMNIVATYENVHGHHHNNRNDILGANQETKHKRVPSTDGFGERTEQPVWVPVAGYLIKCHQKNVYNKKKTRFGWSWCFMQRWGIGVNFRHRRHFAREGYMPKWLMLVSHRLEGVIELDCSFWLVT